MKNNKHLVKQNSLKKMKNYKPDSGGARTQSAEERFYEQLKKDQQKWEHYNKELKKDQRKREQYSGSRREHNKASYRRDEYYEHDENLFFYLPLLQILLFFGTSFIVMIIFTCHVTYLYVKYCCLFMKYMCIYLCTFMKFVYEKMSILYENMSWTDLIGPPSFKIVKFSNEYRKTKNKIAIVTKK